MGWKDKADDFIIKKAFDRFDKDHSGSLQVSELASFLTMVIKLAGGDFQVSQGQAKYAMKAVDKNNDGKISKDQIKVTLIQYQKSSDLRNDIKVCERIFYIDLYKDAINFSGHILQNQIQPDYLCKYLNKQISFHENLESKYYKASAQTINHLFCCIC